MDEPTQVPPPATGEPPHPPPAGPPPGAESAPQRAAPDPDAAHTAAPPDPGAAWGAEPPGWEWTAPSVVVDAAAERARRGLWVWFAIVTVAMVASTAFADAQLGLLAATAGAFAVAHAAERLPGLRLLHRFLVALVALGGALLAAGVVRFVQTSPLPPWSRAIGIGSGAFAGLASVALLSPALAGALARALFRRPFPDAAARLAARIVALAVLLSLPLWVMFRAMLALDTLKDLDLGGASLWGSLFGLGLLALGGVGAFVIRTPSEALARLGLRPLARRDLAWLPLGVAGLWALNTGVEWAQHRWLPAQWAFDQKVVGLMAGDLTRFETVLLGVSAGFGEEIAMRGALQPRLGLVLTALLFAALHVQYSWSGMLTIVAFGLVLGEVRMRASTTTAIAIHAVYDMIAAFGAQQPH